MSTAVRVPGRKLSKKKTFGDPITLDPRGIAYIAGTTMKVRQIVMEAQRLCSSAEEIQDAHAQDNITIEHVRAALDYYESHKRSIDAEIDSEDKFIEQVRSTAYRPDVEALRNRLKQIQSG